MHGLLVPDSRECCFGIVCERPAALFSKWRRCTIFQA